MLVAGGASMKNYLLLFCALFFGCQGSKNTQGVEPQALHLAIQKDPMCLDPRMAEDPSSGMMIRILFDGLMRIGPDGKATPSLCRNYTITNDKMVYTFFLKNAYWSNGDRIKAQDFVLSWKSALDPKFPSPNAYHLFVIKNARKIKNGVLGASSLGVTALDEKTLRIELEDPTPHFLQLLAFDIFYPVHPQSHESTANTTPSHLVTNGPFVLDCWFHTNQLIFKKNFTYWDKNSVTLEKIMLHVVDDVRSTQVMFDNGQLDWLGSPLNMLTPETIAEYARLGKYKKSKGSYTYWYVINTTRRPFNNRKVRQALSAALDRRTLCTAFPLERAAAFHIGPSFLFSPESQLEELSPIRARRLLEEGLKEEDYPIGDFNITLFYNIGTRHQQVAHALANQWKQRLGIGVQFMNCEWSTYLKQLSLGHFELARYGWSPHYTDSLSYLEVFTKQKGTGYNFSRWSLSHYDDLIAQARRQSDVTKRELLKGKAAKLLIDEMPVIPISYEVLGYVKNPHLFGVHYNDLGLIDFKWAYFRKKSGG